MPYCGTTWVAPGTTTCPNGEKPTDRQNGAPAPDAEQAQQSTVSATYGWNQDTTPVILGKTYNQHGSVSGTAPATSNNMSNVADAQNYFNQMWGAGTASDASAADKQSLKSLIAGLRDYTGSKLGTRGSVEQAWHDALKDASRAGVDVFSLLGTKNPADTGDDEGGGGRGYSGPVSTVTRMNQMDLDRTANALAVEMIGRTLSDKEMAKVTQRLRTAETENPSVSGGAASPSMTVQSGLSAEGRQDVLKEVIAENPEYADYQLDHTVLDTMLNVFNQRRAQVRG